MAEPRPTGPVKPTGSPTVGSTGTGGTGEHRVPSAAPGTPCTAGSGPQPTPQPPSAPQPAPQSGPAQNPLDDTRFLIASTNWY